MGTSSETRRKEMEIASNEKIAAENLAFQKEKLAYDQQLQQQIFDREDTAYQRTVKDMRSAGVSPLAMQGTNAAGEAIQTSAPQNGMVYDYTSGMSTDSEKFNNLLNVVGSISNVMAQSQQVRSLRLQNDFTERTLNHRVAREQAQTILSKYNALDARDKRYFQNIFGVNEHMPREQQLANIASVLAMSDDDFNARAKMFSGKSLREFEDSGYDFSKMLQYGSYDSRTVRSLLSDVGSQVYDSLGLEAGLEGISNSEKKDIYGNSNSDYEERYNRLLERQKNGDKLSLKERAFLKYWSSLKSIGSFFE